MFYIFDNVSSFGVGSNGMYLWEQNVDSFCIFVNMQSNSHIAKKVTFLWYIL